MNLEKAVELEIAFLISQGCSERAATKYAYRRASDPFDFQAPETVKLLQAEKAPAPVPHVGRTIPKK